MVIASFLESLGIPLSWIISSAIIFIRYCFFAGLAFLVFYYWKKVSLQHRKIQASVPDRKQILLEIRNSLTTAFIFGACAIAVVMLKSAGVTLIYTDIHHYGYVYFLASFALIILFHDAYFYWSHRLMHHRKVFRHMHHVHHRSHNPTPWAAFSFHPFEALVEFMVLPIAVIIIPLHPIILISWSLWMITFNVIGHLGYEIVPSGRWWSKYLNTSTHHNIHHQKSRGNYSLYFNYWDALMKTNVNLKN